MTKSLLNLELKFLPVNFVTQADETIFNQHCCDKLNPFCPDIVLNRDFIRGFFHTFSLDSPARQTLESSKLLSVGQFHKLDISLSILLFLD